MEDWVFLTATSWCTSLGMRQGASLFGVSQSAVGHWSGWPASRAAAPTSPRQGYVLIVGGKLVPAYDPRGRSSQELPLHRQSSD